MSLVGHSAILTAFAGAGLTGSAAAAGAGLGEEAAFIRCAPLVVFAEAEADTADAATVVLYSSWLMSPLERSRCASRSLASPVVEAVRIVAASSAVKMPLDCKSCTSGFDAVW